MVKISRHDRNVAYYWKNREKELSRNREWSKSHKPMRNAAAIKYAKNHPELVRESNREWRKRNQDYLRLKKREYRELNREKIKTYNKIYNKERYSRPEIRYAINQRAKIWHQNNRDKARAASRKWQKNHLVDCKFRTHLYRALKKKAAINLKGINLFMRLTKAKKVVVCYYCGKETPSFGCHFDHIIPLSKGGSHSVENLCVSCPYCNNSKHDKLIGEWNPKNQFVLPI